MFMLAFLISNVTFLPTLFLLLWCVRQHFLFPFFFLSFFPIFFLSYAVVSQKLAPANFFVLVLYKLTKYQPYERETYTKALEKERNLIHFVLSIWRILAWRNTSKDCGIHLLRFYLYFCIQFFCAITFIACSVFVSVPPFWWRIREWC